MPVTPFAARPATRSSDAFSHGVKAEDGEPFEKSPGSPRWNDIAQVLPPRSTSTSRRSESALTTDAPTPCRPPDAAYDPPNYCEFHVVDDHIRSGDLERIRQRGGEIVVRGDDGVSTGWNVIDA